MGPLCLIQGSKMMLKIVAVLVLAAVLVAEVKTGKKLKRNPNTKARLYLRQAGPCNGTDFQCKNGQCIQNDWVCDTEADCTDGSDELDCHKVQCPAGEVQCDNYICIEAQWVCDGDDDCRDGWDERNCTGSCRADQFRCGDGSRCIDARWQCDGDDDCNDASDELNCKCDDATQFTCANGRCIDAGWKCDGDNDCGDASDEKNCPTLHPSLCGDMMSIRDCALMNETAHPICMDAVDGHKYCRKYCGLCIDMHTATHP